MATGYTREWIQFFTGCGIPDDVASMYALIFYENRIQKNMLLDLNKEYLRDMGITVMGDVIAILRHAKIIHEKYLRAQILSVEDNITIEKTNSIEDSSPALKKTTPMKRMLEHYTRKYQTPDIEPVSQVQVILPIEKATTMCEKGEEKIGPQRPLKKKIVITNTDKELKEKGLEVPVPKVRRVLPENEGRYKIKMPSGTTEKSKKLLEQAKKRKAKTVFDRLGESSVSSTTSEISTISSSSSSPLSREKNPSVFSRLGEKTPTPIVSSTSTVDDSEVLPPDQLPYAGVFKPGTTKKTFVKSTMRADEQQQSESKVKKGMSVKKRLGLTTADQAPQQKITLKAVRRLADGQTKTTTITPKFNVSGMEIKSNEGKVIIKSLGPNTHSTKGGASQVSSIEIIKRKLDDDSGISPSKKVRFGRTTHRLIPASSNSQNPVNYMKNYPKLTMIISNRDGAMENNTLSSGIKIGSLNSDSLSDRVGVKARIGNKLLKGRLGKQTAKQGVIGPKIKKAPTVKDRLG